MGDWAEAEDLEGGFDGCLLDFSLDTGIDAGSYGIWDLQDVPVLGMPGQITSKGTVLDLVLGSSRVSDSNISFVASPTMACRSTLLVLLVAAICFVPGPGCVVTGARVSK